MSIRRQFNGARMALESGLPALLIILVMTSASALAQEGPGEQDAQPVQALRPLTDAESAALDELQKKIESDKIIIDLLTERLDSAEGIAKSITFAIGPPLLWLTIP